MSDLIARLRSGAPCGETWHELASRTNGERAEAADRIAELEQECQLLSATNKDLDAKLADLEAQPTAQQVEDAIVRLESAARAAIEHVGSANYKHRIAEAHKMIDAALQAGKEKE